MGVLDRGVHLDLPLLPELNFLSQPLYLSLVGVPLAGLLTFFLVQLVDGLLEVADCDIFHQNLPIQVLFPGLEDLVIGYFFPLPVQLPVLLPDRTLEIRNDLLAMDYLGPEVGDSPGVLVVLSSDVPKGLVVPFEFGKFPAELLNPG